MVLNALPALITTAQTAQMSLIGPHLLSARCLRRSKAVVFTHTRVMCRQRISEAERNLCWCHGVVSGAAQSAQADTTVQFTSSYVTNVPTLAQFTDMSNILKCSGF